MVIAKFPLLVTLLWLVLTVSATSRTPQIGRAEDAAKHEGGTMECLGALLELKSCSNEILLFFLNGGSHLGVDCCRAIRIITHECWPSMLSSLGFTAQEGDILSHHCSLSFTPPSVGPHV
ncbi:egg cell-secreted protein 1.4-like [Henckelia pumila]|uniref:egg cell-secreted protein 1.4-like n=1 Tax=Henckelia pumila TaxID=405737 RepID=UPI003C6DD0DD